MARSKMSLVSITCILASSLLIFNHIVFTRKNEPQNNVLIEPVHNTEPVSTTNCKLSTLKDPSNLPYNLVGEGPHWSQLGQDRVVDTLLEGKRGGFFIEAGGYDGEQHSNTLFLERSRGWSGVLIEANPHLFHRLENKKRKCYIINAGLSMSGQAQAVNFRMAGPLGGFSELQTQEHLQRISSEIDSNQPWMQGDEGSGSEVEIMTYPLQDLLQCIEEKTRQGIVVDFFSLDTEGSEYDILKAIDFSLITIGVMVVEYNGNEAAKNKIIALMETNRFQVKSSDGTDIWFTNPSYFQSMKLQHRT